MFIFQRRVHVYETDLMGIVHHSNYIRYCEEARVQFLITEQMMTKAQSDVFSLAVLDIRFKYLKPLKFGDLFSIEVRIRTEGLRVFIQYRLRDEKNKICVLAETIHCSLNKDLKVIRLDPLLVAKVNKYNLNDNSDCTSELKNRPQKSKENPWIETWL